MLSVSVSKLSSHEQQGRGPERAARKHEHGPRQDLFTRIPTGGRERPRPEDSRQGRQWPARPLGFPQVQGQVLDSLREAHLEENHLCNLSRAQKKINVIKL